MCCVRARIAAGSLFHSFAWKQLIFVSSHSFSWLVKCTRLGLTEKGCVESPLLLFLLLRVVVDLITEAKHHDKDWTVTVSRFCAGDQ